MARPYGVVLFVPAGEKFVLGVLIIDLSIFARLIARVERRLVEFVSVRFHRVRQSVVVIFLARFVEVLDFPGYASDACYLGGLFGGFQLRHVCLVLGFVSRFELFVQRLFHCLVDACQRSRRVFDGVVQFKVDVVG
jgi:hypothetical protein